MNGVRRSLLLLPFSQGSPSRRSIADLYKRPVTAALSRVKSPDHSATLVIAVVGSFLHQAPAGDPRISWPCAQSMLAGLYSLASYICAQQSIAMDMNAGPNSVDARVVLVHDDRSRASRGGAMLQTLSEFAGKGDSWTSVFHLKTEEGRQLAEYYTEHINGEQQTAQSLIGLDCDSATQRADSPLVPAESLSRQYKVVCLGGTFDHLHPGHKLLLSAATLLLGVPSNPESPCRFIIGVTGDEMLKNKRYAEYVQSWDARAQGVLEFLHAVIDHSTSVAPTFASEGEGRLVGSFRGGAVVVECVVFQDLYGPTISVEEIEALVVSGETREGGKAVNDKRRGQGWRELDVYEVDVLDARGVADEGQGTEDFGAKISSTAIRQQKATGGLGNGRL